jgi:hypothetical protein
MKKFGEKNLDVLQNIEFGIVEVYRADRSLLDIDVKDAIDALIRHYHAEEERRTPPVMRLGDRAQMVFVRQRPLPRLAGRDPPLSHIRPPLGAKTIRSTSSVESGGGRWASWKCGSAERRDSI